jgi:pectate lyase
MSFITKGIDNAFIQTGVASARWLSLALLLTAAPALAQTSNFGTLTLNSTKTVGTLNGTTGGSTSLPAITSNADRDNNKCLGFGDPTPDHILVLQQKVQDLTLQVSSDDSDTTLVVQGPDGVVRCADNIVSRKPVAIRDTEWQAGSYQIWVGTINPGVRRNYTLTVRQ